MSEANKIISASRGAVLALREAVFVFQRTFHSPNRQFYGEINKIDNAIQFLVNRIDKGFSQINFLEDNSETLLKIADLASEIEEFSLQIYKKKVRVVNAAQIGRIAGEYSRSSFDNYFGKSKDIEGGLGIISKNFDFSIQSIHLFCASYGLNLKEYLVDTYYALITPKPSIEHAIEFAPEQKQAGMKILSYFAEVLENKYPDKNVRVTLHQDGPKVTMNVYGPDGVADKIEESLEQYMLVVRGVNPPQSLFEDKIEILKLENMLEMARMETRQAERIAQIAERQRDNALGRLGEVEERQAEAERRNEDRFTSLLALMDASIRSESKLREVFAELLGNAESRYDGEVVDLLRCLKKLAESEQTDEIVNKISGVISDIHEKEPSVLSHLQSLLLVGGIQGVAGNVLTNIIAGVVASMPKI